jgi:hypothetical protein
MNNFAKYLMLVAPLLVSCGPPSPTDDTAENEGGSTLEADCASFCDRAVDCESEEWAADWGYESEQECVDYCVLFTNSKVKFHDEPACEATTRAMWTCAGLLETCEDFELFENAVFGMAGIGGKPCADESMTFLDDCN